MSLKLSETQFILKINVIIHWKITTHQPLQRLPAKTSALLSLSLTQARMRSYYHSVRRFFRLGEGNELPTQEPFEHEFAWQSIDDCMVDSDFDKTKRFLPTGDLDRIITTAFVLKAMDVRQNNEQISPLVEYVLKKGKRLFSISVYTGFVQEDLQCAMELFKDADFDDSKLPIGRTQSGSPALNAAVPNPTFTNSAAHANLTLLHQPDKKKVWSNGKIAREFFEKQWMFLAPVFSTDEPTRNIPALSILPFIQKQLRPKKGPFSHVFKCEIHADHIRDPLHPVR